MTKSIRRTHKRKQFRNTRKHVSKAICNKQTLKKYLTRPSPPYRAPLCIGQTKRGNDGNMYISKPGINYGPAKWIKIK